mmetsp:Transcript_6638/g.8038  ORF Transcript_6638/g.8038 Transcript_6638/m.8038 type:complete len:174 (+) Transcript_6638:181-702(+)
MAAQQLLESAKNGDLQTLLKLLKRGVFVDTKDDNKRTPLIIAARHGHAEYCDAAIKYGAKIEAKDKHGDTAFVACVRKGDFPEVLKVLIKRHAKTQHTNYQGYCAMHFTVMAKRMDSLEYLLSRKARWAQKNMVSGLNCMEMAAEMGNIEAIRILLKYGATLETTDPVRLSLR